MVQLETTQTSIQSLYKRIQNPDNDIDPGEIIEICSDFQRGDDDTGVWSNEAKKKYITSLMNNYPSGLISIVKAHISRLKSMPYKVLDGGNRARTIRDFMNNKFCLNEGLYFGSDDPDIRFEGDNIGEIRRNRFMTTCIAFQKITIERNDPSTTISEMFTCLNTSSVALKPGELIKSHGWLKDKSVIEMAKQFVGDVWETDSNSDVVSFMRREWVQVFCDGDASKFKEGKRCDSLAMICGYIVSSITGDFKTFDRRYDSIKKYLDHEISQEDIMVFVSKMADFLDIMKDVYIRDIFGKLTHGIPSRNLVAPIWYSICRNGNDAATPAFKHKIKRFFRAMIDDNKLRAEYFALRDSGSNGETTTGKMGKIESMIKEWTD
jgi:hypothetical protein